MKIVLTILLLTTYLFSAPAFNKLREFKNADGTKFLAKGMGNEHLHWIESSSGEILKYNKKSKNFEYAIVVDERLKASGEIYNINQKNVGHRAISRVKKVTKEKLYKLLKRVESSKRRVAHY